VDAIAVAALVLVLAFAGALVGTALARRLPEHHLNAASKDAIRLAVGLVATLSALVLGMLISVASGIYQTQRNEVQRLAADVLLLDRILAPSGAEAAPARAALRDATAAAIERMWPVDGARAALAPGAQRERGDAFWHAINALQARDDEQRAAKACAIALASDLAQTRLLLYAQRDSGVPGPFLGVLAVWIALIFTGFGFMTPRNPTVTGVFLAAALCVGGAFFLLIEMTRPFDGVMRLSPAPLRDAVALIGR
jgi:hypothetical protein